MRESLRRLASDEAMERNAGSNRRVRVELLDGDHITVDLDVSAEDYIQTLHKIFESMEFKQSRQVCDNQALLS